MKNKNIPKKVLAFILFSFVYWGFFFVKDLAKHTTYGEVISDVFDGKTITEIIIYDEGSKNWEDWNSVTITDNDTIKNILEGPSKIKLKETDDFIGQKRKYSISAVTDEIKSYSIELSEDLIYIYGVIYSTNGDIEIYRIINEIYTKNFNEKSS